MINIDGDLPGAITVLDDQLARQPIASPSNRPLRAIRESAAMLAAQPNDVGYLRDTIDLAVAARDFAFAADLARVVAYATMIFEGAGPALRFLDETSCRFDDASASTVALEFLAERVHCAVLAGRPADALTYADVVLERPAPRRPWQAALNFRARALELMGHLDDAIDSLEPLLDTVTDDFVGRGELLATRAELALWSGRTEVALELAERRRRSRHRSSTPTSCPRSRPRGRGSNWDEPRHRCPSSRPPRCQPAPFPSSRDPRSMTVTRRRRRSGSRPHRRSERSSTRRDRCTVDGPRAKPCVRQSGSTRPRPSSRPLSSMRRPPGSRSWPSGSAARCARPCPPTRRVGTPPLCRLVPDAS